MVPTGNRERIELDRAPSAEDTEHGVWSSLERTRWRERVARHEETTCGLSSDPHAEDAIGWQGSASSSRTTERWDQPCAQVVNEPTRTLAQELLRRLTVTPAAPDTGVDGRVHRGRAAFQ